MHTGHVLDLTRHAFWRTRGDIAVVGTWVGTSHDEAEPCLALIPAGLARISHERVRPCVIGLSAAYRYADPTYLLLRAREIAEQLGFSDSMSRTHAIATAIHDHLQDLIELPPRPSHGAYVAADAIITDRDSGRSHEAEVIDHH